MNDTTINLLLKTLDTQPENWEIRLHIAELMLADARNADAAELIGKSNNLPDDEELLLKIAKILSTNDKDKSLRILDGIIANNKACAPAYRIKADIYRSRGMETEARKN